LGTAPTDDPTNQSGKEDTVNVLIDQLDEDFDTPDFAFLVAEVENNLSTEQKKTGAMDESVQQIVSS
jgi:hypothetical protein